MIDVGCSAMLRSRADASPGEHPTSPDQHRRFDIHHPTSVTIYHPTSMSLTIDYTNMMSDVVAGGIAAGDWETAGRDFGKTHAGLLRRRQAGELGFLDLPGDAKLLAQSTS